MSITLEPRLTEREFDVYLDGEYAGHLICSAHRLVLYVLESGKSHCFTHAAEMVRYLLGGKYGKTQKT